MAEDAPIADGEGAVYCRVAHRRSVQQVGLDQREAACRELAACRGIHVPPWQVYIDPLAASWSRRAAAPAWEALLRALATRGVRSVVVFDVGELEQFQPRELAELLCVAERYDVALHDPHQAIDLNAPGNRRMLVERVQAASRRRSRLADAGRAAREHDAASGRPHGGGRRAFGYTSGTYNLIPAEAAVVARVYAWFLDGRTLSWIARELTATAIPAAAGGAWSPTKVARIIDAPRYAGLRVKAGRIHRDADDNPVQGTWIPCVSLSDWEAAQALRRLTRDSAQAGPERYYPLTGLVRCGRCGHRMVGSDVDGYPMYACTGRRVLGRQPCFRYISATRVEELVDEEVVTIVEGIRSLDPKAPTAVLDTKAAESRDHDQVRLVHLSEDLTSTEERARVVARIRAENRAVVLRASAGVERLLAAHRPRPAWQRLTHSEQAEVRRYLIARVEIGPVIGPRSVFDPARVLIVPRVDRPDAQVGTLVQG